MSTSRAWWLARLSGAALLAALPTQLRTRTIKGKQQHYLVRPKALSDGAQATARLLLVWQIDAVEQLRRVPLLHERGAAGRRPCSCRT